MTERRQDPQEIEDRIVTLSIGLPSVRRQNWADIGLLAVVVVMGTVALVGTFLGLPGWLETLSVVSLVFISFVGAYLRVVSRPDHVRALQSDRMLSIANHTTSFLRRGLNPEIAAEVCRIVLRETEAASVAITDLDCVLGFAGVGEDHHRVGGPIITRATHEALDTDQPQILHSKEDIGCPDPKCRLRAAIVVPLQMRGEPVGTLKFYYTSDGYLNETQLAMAEGLAALLSTQLELSELERQTKLATEMELKALQAQINPHFLFNTINTIAAFIRTDPMEARRLLRQFGTFYRRTLENSEDLVTLADELDFVNSYVELEHARFGDRLELFVDVDERALSMPMPSFMLQPLVENAVGHGMRPDGSTLNVTIGGRYAGDALVLSVQDDGVGIPPAKLPTVLDIGAGKGLGIALRNVRDRLRGHFGAESEFEIESVEGEGTCVRLTIRPVPTPVDIAGAATLLQP